jgi:nitrite reductase/ring-hydroxylating ferredoxin subunit
MKHFVASVDELSEDGSQAIVDVDGFQIVVFYVGGEYHALADYCIHQGARLSEGKLTGKMEVGADGISKEYDEDHPCVICPWHEWKFDVETGRNVSDDQYVTPTFDVSVEDEGVYVHR